jgi:hypothetical protein
VRLSESIVNSEKSSGQQGVLIGEKEEGEGHHHFRLMIGGINISLGLIFVGDHVCEEVM